MQCSDRNGNLVGAVQVFEGDELMLISDQGTLVRTRTDEISVLSRNTQGVRVIRLKEDEHLVGVERIAESENTVLDMDGADDASSVDETGSTDEAGSIEESGSAAE